MMIERPPQHNVPNGFRLLMAITVMAILWYNFW